MLGIFSSLATAKIDIFFDMMQNFRKKMFFFVENVLIKVFL